MGLVLHDMVIYESLWVRKLTFYISGNERKFNIEAATSYLFIDVRRVNLWLALDAACAENIQSHKYIMDHLQKVSIAAHFQNSIPVSLF